MNVVNGSIVNGTLTTVLKTPEQASAASVTIGCFLAIIGGCFASCANMLLKYTQLKMTDVPEAERPHIISTPQFWIVFFLYVFNAVADFAAYAFAPLSVVSPISGVVIIFNAFLANRIFGEKLGWSDLVGSVLILLGGSLSVVFGSRQEAKRTLQELEELWTHRPFVIFASAQFFLLFALFGYTRTLSPEWRGFKHWVLDAFCFVGIVPRSWTDCLETPADVLEEFKERQKIRFESSLALNALSLALLATFAGCWTNMLGKSVSEIIGQSVSGANQFTRPSAFFMVGGILFMAIFQLRFITQMLRTFEAVLIVPLYQCSFTIFLIIFGLVFFEEFEAMSPSDIGGFCAAVVVACVGIGIVSARPIPTDEELKAAITGGVHDAPAADAEAAAATTSATADAAIAATGTTAPANESGSDNSAPATDAAAAVSVYEIALVESTSVQLEMTALSSASASASSPSADAASTTAASSAVAESSAPSSSAAST